MMTVTPPNNDEIRTAREAAIVPKLAAAAILFLAAGLLLDLFAFVSSFVFPGFARNAGLFSRVHFLVRVGTVISFLLWLHARYSSLRLVGWTAPNYTPGAAVGWFFVPLLNLYKPYLVVQEMWGATEPGSSTNLGDSRLVLAWWVAFIGAPLSFFALTTPRLFASSLPGNLELLFICALNIVAGTLAVLVVARLDSRWQSKFDAIHAIAAGTRHGTGAQAAASTTQNSGRIAVPVARTEPPDATLPQMTGEERVPAHVPYPEASPEAVPSPALPAQAPDAAFTAATPAPPRPRPVMSDGAAMDAIANRMLRTRKSAIVLASVSAATAAALLTAAGFTLVRTTGAHDTVRHFAIILALVYVGLALIALIPGVQLFRFARDAARFTKSRATSDLEAALRLQSRFWRFAGVATIAVVVVECSAIFLAVATSLLESVL